MLNIGTRNAKETREVTTYLLAIVGMDDNGRPQMANIDLVTESLTKESIAFAVDRHCAAARDKGVPLQARNTIVLSAIKLEG